MIAIGSDRFEGRDFPRANMSKVKMRPAILHHLLSKFPEELLLSLIML